MKTIKVSVTSDADAQILINLLNSMKMELSIEPDAKATIKDNQYLKLEAILKNQASSNLFKKITDPVQWQKELRNEWQ